jgi:hypothetical protein
MQRAFILSALLLLAACGPTPRELERERAAEAAAREQRLAAADQEYLASRSPAVAVNPAAATNDVVAPTAAEIEEAAEAARREQCGYSGRDTWQEAIACDKPTYQVDGVEIYIDRETGCEAYWQVSYTPSNSEYGSPGMPRLYGNGDQVCRDLSNR